MLRLDTQTRKLQAVLASAVLANQLPVIVSYSDKTATAYTGATQLSVSNSTTAVDICAAPGAATVRDIDYLSVRNNDTQPAAVTIRLNDNGTLYTVINSILQVGDTLVYTHSQGWQVNSANPTCNILRKVFIASTDYTAGSSTTLTLPSAPASVNNLWMFYDGVFQESTEYSVNGSTITTTSAIPASVLSIECIYTQPISIGIPSDGTVTSAKLTGDLALPGMLGIGTNVQNTFDQVAQNRPLVVAYSDPSTTVAGSRAALVISNTNTTTNNTAQLNFATLTGSNANHFSSAAISCTFGARTNGQYSTGNLLFSTSSAANTAPTEKVRLDNVGNVGIGDTSPALRGKFSSATPNGLGFTAINNSIGGSGGSQLSSYYNTVKVGYFDIQLNDGTPGVEKSQAAIGVMINGSLTSALLVDQNGNVGIGGSPSYDLDITKTKAAGTTYLRCINTDTGGTSQAYISAAQGIVSTSIWSYGNTVGSVGTNTAHNLNLVTNNVPRVVLDTIGNTTQSTSYNGMISYTITNLNAGASAETDVYITSNAGALRLQKVSAALGSYSQIISAAGYLNIITSDATPIYWGTNNVARLTVDASGNILNLSTGGLGYGTGSGGAVTQITSRTTAVVLNKTNGGITLFSKTTTAGLVETFTLTNSTIAATDVVTVCVRQSTGIYFVNVTKVAAGSCNISVYTPAAVGTAEAPVLQFAVIKSVIA